MALIYETENFMVESHERPEVDRLDGGHIKISPKKPIVDRTKLTPRQAIEIMRLTIVAGKAMKDGLLKRGIKLGRINYQDNGNWTPHFHIHLYGRAIDARFQKFGEPVIPGHKKDFKQLDRKDISAIREEIIRLFKEKKFQDSEWKF